MAAKTAENGQCEAPADSGEGMPGSLDLVTVQEATPLSPAEEAAAPKPSLKRFEDLPEMVEMLSPLYTEDDGNKTDVENLSDHETMDMAEEKTAPSHKEEDSGDENQTDVEDLDMGSARHHGVLHENPSASKAEDSKVTAKRFVEEVQLDNLEHKKVSKQNKWHRGNANHLGQKPSHSRQRSHSQPSSLSSPGAVEACPSPRSASSETEFANLSAHVRAVLGELDVRTQKFKATSEAKKSRSRCATSGLPYRLMGRADQELMLRKFFVEEDVGTLTDEGEFVIMPEPKSPTGRLTTGVEELDVSSGGTDVEELEAEPHRAVNSGGEWTETDPDSGEVRHIISKTTHTTVTSVKPTEGAPRGDTMSTTVSRSSKDDHRGSAASAPSDRDEAESLTFFQKKEFFEKLSEQSPPQEALSARLGSTPSLDTALTRPAVSLKPRPRSESLTSQGEIIEESIVFAERLRLFQGGTSSAPSAGLPQLDDLVELQPHQRMEEKDQVAPVVSDSSQSRILEDLQDLEGKGGTRLLVHTSDADKEAFDVRSVQVSEDIRDQQFSRMRVRVPALEESVTSAELPEQKTSPLRDAYKDSLLTAQQESGQVGKPADPSPVVDDVCLEHGATADLMVPKAELSNQTNKDTFDRLLTRERDASLLSSQSHLLASGLQMGIVAGPGILQQGIIASSQSAILETLSSSPTDLMASEFALTSGMPPEEVGPTEEARGRDVGRVGALVAAAPVAVLPVSDILSGKQLEMLDIAQVSEESSLLEAGVQRSSHGELSQPCPKEKTIMKTEYADIQHKLSSAFGESLTPVESKTSIIHGMPKEVLEALDRSSQEFVASKLDDEESEQVMHIASATTDSVLRELIPEQSEKAAGGATSEPGLEDPARDVALHLTALHLASEQVEIPTEEGVVEEEKLQALVASSACSERGTSDEDAYHQDIQEFIAVLEDYEPLPVSSLAELKPGSHAVEPSLFHGSDFLSKTTPDREKKAKESSSSCVEEHSDEASKTFDPDTRSKLMGEDTDLLTEEHSSAKCSEPTTVEPLASDHKDDVTGVASKIKFKEKEEKHLDEPSLVSHDSEETSTFPCVETEVKNEQCAERSLDATRVSDREESLADDTLVGLAQKGIQIDTSTLTPDGAVTDHEAPLVCSDLNVHEFSDTVNKISDLPLSHGGDDRRGQGSPEKILAVAAEVPTSLAEDTSHRIASAGCPKAGVDMPYSSDEDQQKELSKYKEVELAIPFLHAGSSSLEDEVEDGGSFSSGDLQAEKIAEFLTADSDLSNQMIHFPQVFQDNLIPAQQEPCVSSGSLASGTALSVEKRVNFILDRGTVDSPPGVHLKSDRQSEMEEASRIVDSVVHMASSLVESLHEVGPDVASNNGICDRGIVNPVGSPPEGSEISETFSQAVPTSAVEKDRQEGHFGVKEMYEVLKESRSAEDRVQYSVTSLGEPLIADDVDDDPERRRRSSPAAESMDDQAQIEKCSREVMMQLLDGFSKSDVELAEVRTEDEAPDIEDDVPSPEAGSQEDKSVPSSQDNSGDLQPQLSTEVEIGSQASGALAPLSELDYELCPDAERTSGDEAMATGVPPLEPERDPAVAESSHAPSAAADPATSAVRSVGGRERSPLLEASPPEETAYRPEQDVSPAQEYPEYLTPDMQVRVGVSPTEMQPAKEKPARYSESSVESSSEVGSPCPPSQGGTAMAFENVAFAGEDVIDATSSPVEESSSPAGSRSPYEVVRDAPTEETTSVALMEAEKSLRHAVQEETCARPQSLVSEERSEQPEVQITTKIFAFDQSPGVRAPEKKELSEGLLGVGLLTVSDMTARTPESRRGDSDEDEEEWADHVMSKIRGRPIPPTPPASPRTVQSAVEVQGEQVTWEAPVEQQEGVQVEVAEDIAAGEPAVVEHGENGVIGVTKPCTDAQEMQQTSRGKRPQLEHIPSEISDEDLVEREQSPTHMTATCRGDRKDSSSDRNSSPDSDSPRASGSHRRSASGVGTSVFEASHTQESGENDKQSHESHDKGTQEDDKITEEPEDTMFVIEEETPAGTNRSELPWGDTSEKAAGITGGLSPGFDSPPKTHDGSSSGKLDAASPVVLRSKSKRTEKRSEKRSSRDMDTGHSGSETDHSHYYSFEMASDSGKTPGASRPTSSEFDLNVLSGQASSEYETCATSQDGEVSGSYATAAASSHDTSFATARSSLSGSSRGSAYSVDSESSGHLGSMEVSEASETIVASAHEELDSDNESERSKSVLREPYDGEIPESVIRGGVEHPFLPSWQSTSKDSGPTAHGSTSTRPSTSEGVYSSFQSSAPVEPGRSYAGWMPVSSSAASSDSSRGTARAEVLNGAGASAPPDGQERRLRPSDDHMASSHEEEQLSVSESSATQSEHTWQTSVETMVDAVEAQHFSCDSERHHRQSTMQNLASLPLDQTAVVEDAEGSHSVVNDNATPPFQEVNGPVEVDYVPEYDDLAAGRPVEQQDASEGQAEAQGDEAIVDAADGDESASHELDEQENSAELREEGFYAETFQGDLSSEEVESAANEALLLGSEYCHERMTCHVSSTPCDGISPGESFERPVAPEPLDKMDAPDGSGYLVGHSAATSVFEHPCPRKSPTLIEKDAGDSNPENEPQECAQGSKDMHPFQDHPRCESASSSPETATADDIKLYTSKCEDYILKMHQTYRYGVGLPKSSDEHYPPEEGMDVENVKLLESRLQEGSVSQQDFPYDLSYEQEYVGDVRVEHGDLYTHQEVEEEAYDDERARLRGRRRLSPISDERGSTPDYDTLAGRKMFGKGSEKDDASTSSLMEFERLEAEMASGTKSSSLGSSDSFSGRQQQGRNGTCSEQDSVSLNSLTEFERLEKELVEAEGVDARLRGEVVARLDEIDEGHESQASDPGHETTVYDENGVMLLRQAPSGFHASEQGRMGGETINVHSDENQSAQELQVGWSRTERHFLTTRTESGHSVDSVDRQSSASTATQFDTDSLRDREIDDSECNFCPDTPGWTQKECTDLDSLHDSLHDAEHHDSLQEVLSKENDSLQLRDPSGDPDSLQDDRNELQDSLYEAQEIDFDSFRAEETSAADGTSHIWQQFPSQIRTTELSPTMSRPASSPLVVPVVVERIDTLTWVDQDSARVPFSDGESLTRPLERPCNDALVSSTDSLEPTSSANTHATYQCDTDSMMSSLNSAEESTMVSSTDTLDHETLHFTTQGKPFSLEGGLLVDEDLAREFFDPDTTDTSRQNKRISLEGRVSADDIEERFRECLLRSAVSPTDEEQVEERQTIDEKGNLIVTRTVKRHVTSEPQLHTQTFAGPDAEQQSREFVASFAAMEPSSEKDEYEGFDTAGNAVRVTQHVLVRPTVKTVTFTGPDARLQMREYMRSLAGGQHSSAENTPTSDSGVGACSSLASPQPLAPDPPAAAPTSACPGLQRLSGGDHWMEAESALDDSSQPVTATRVITTRTTRTVGPDGREQLVTTTTSCEEGGDEPETRLRRSMQGVLDSFMAEPPPRSDEE